ncbi:MAG: HAD-IIB family hydrolase [Lachnospiraceae bacterium]|nr:HAD-IIB family hydrolase [Lachnospiraceae bacterium]
MKIVFFDIDGTLYDREDPRKIPQSALDAIRRIQADGNIVIICTGRCMSCIEPYIRQIGFDGYIAGCGTHIIYRGRELWYQTLEAETVRELDFLCKQARLMPVFEGSRYLYADERDCTGDNLRFYHFYKAFYKGKLKPIDYRADDICKLTVRVEADFEGTDAKEQKKAAVRHVAGKAELLGMTVLDKGASLEIFPRENGKGEGIRRFLTLTGLSGTTYAFGDSINDLDMMQQVDYSVALGHAHPRLLSICSCQTDDLYDDGIYKACKKLNLIS